MTATQTAPEPPSIASPSNAPGRLTFLDWTRGIAAAIMLQGHVFHSFARPELRDGGPYVLSQFIGGITPAIFLFLTGVTLAFLMHSRGRKGGTSQQRIHAALRRAGYLLLLAFAFRIQLWAFGYPGSPTHDLLKVDILNCMALAMAAMAGMAALSTSQRVQAGIVAGALIAVLSPVATALSGPHVPEIVRMYLVPDANYFSFFPWASFVAFGISAGSILRLVHEDQMHRLMQWAAILGFGLILSGQYFSNIPYSVYPASDFWLNSPGLIFIKTGVILLLLAVAFLWTHHGAGNGWSWVRTLGTNSLLVYWVHIELVYGRWFGLWKESLTVGQCVLASITVTLAMIGLCWLRRNWNWPALRLGSALPEPRRVSGD